MHAPYLESAVISPARISPVQAVPVDSGRFRGRPPAAVPAPERKQEPPFSPEEQPPEKHPPEEQSLEEPPDAQAQAARAKSRPAAETVATNVRRLMARDGLTFSDVVEMTGLDERTVRGLVRGSHNPHARTLHKFAGGLGVSIDELFEPTAALSERNRLARQAFDRATNPAVREVVEHLQRAHSPLFDAWGEADFQELYSQFGTGGALNEQGVLAAAEVINAKRALLRQVAVILETAEADLLADFVKLLYRRVTLHHPTDPQ